MSTWTKQKLGDVCDVGDGAHTSVKRVESGIKYLTSKNFKDGRLDLSSVDYISHETYSKLFHSDSKALTTPQKSDILFSIIGSIGSPYINSSGEKFGISSSVSILRPNIESVIPSYLFYWIRGPIFQNAIKGIKGGVAQGYVSLEMIKTLPLYSPSINQQEKISSILSAYDDLIENNKKRIKILEEMAERLYREWFVKFNYPGSTYAKASADRHEKVRLIDSGTEYGKIPEGWEVKRLGDIVNIVSGFPFKSTTYLEDGKYKIVTIKNVHDGVFVLNFDSFINDLPAKLPANCVLNSGDVLLSLTGNVGRVCIVYGADYLLNQRVAKLEPIGSSVREFMYLLFRQRKFQQKLEAISNGAAQQNLSPIQMKELEIVIPPKKILDKYSNICRNYFDEIVALYDRNLNLSKTRDLLIPQLVTGKREFKN